MKTSFPHLLAGFAAFLLALIFPACLLAASLLPPGTVVAWGDTRYGQTSVPAGLGNVVQIAASGYHSLALKSDGTVVAWGDSVPAGLGNVMQVAAGFGHNLALKSDGTVSAWGDNGLGQSSVPAGLSNVVQIAAGSFHSLALQSDGTVVAWGQNVYGQTSVPAGLVGVVQIAAGGPHSLALKSDGTVVVWGRHDVGQSSVPAGLGNVVQIAAGDSHSLALKSDGTVVAWGLNVFGESNVPVVLRNVMQIAAGYNHSLAIVASLSDGLVAYYPFNGNANDASGNGNNGSVIDAALVTDRFGTPNSAYDFNGTSAAIEIGNTFAMQDQQTVVVWINPSTVAVKQPILEKSIPGYGGEVDFELLLESNGKLTWLVNTNDGGTGTFSGGIGSVSIPAHQWSCIAGVINRSSNETRLYVNGVLAVADSMGGRSVRNYNRPFRIGKGIGNQFNGHFDGKIDDVRIYNRALSAVEAAAAFRGDFIPTAFITFYHQPGGAGHTFLAITSRYGDSDFSGFYASNWTAFFYGPGKISDDRNTAWDYKISYPITTAEYAAAAALIYRDSFVSTPNYFLPDFNCMDWVKKIATAAGIQQLPPYEGVEVFKHQIYAPVSDPAVFGQSLVNIGDGNTYMGGTVTMNPSPLAKLRSASSAVATPFDYSYNGLESAGHADPAALANSIGIPYDHVNFGTVNANSINGVSLNLTGADASLDVISIKWGDGSALQEQSLAFSHVYTAGTYAAQLLVIDAGAVHSYDMTVVVSSSTATSVTVNVTPFSPVSIPNQGLVPAGPVPDFIVVRSTSVSVLTNGHAVVGFLGVPSWIYTIEATSDLTQGFLPVGSVTAGGDGTFQYDDPATVGVGSRFYRATYP